MDRRREQTIRDYVEAEERSVRASRRHGEPRPHDERQVGLLRDLLTALDATRWCPSCHNTGWIDSDGTCGNCPAGAAVQEERARSADLRRSRDDLIRAARKALGLVSVTCGQPGHREAFGVLFDALDEHDPDRTISSHPAPEADRG